jgi:2',3'-cyclic-nucleotide 2'-phosphodiesterase (5'-nucleotidase family)
MSKHYQRLGAALGALLLAASLAGTSAEAAAPAPAPQKQTVNITILGVGDLYDFAIGGFTKLNAVAKAEKAANPNIIYVMTGDMLSPSLLSGFDKGANTIEMTNLVPFDLAVPGNHEFDFGPDNFAEKMKLSKYPWGAVNITVNGAPVPGLSGTIIKDVGGVKVALVPVAQDTTPTVSSPGNWKFGDTVAAAVAGAKAARMAGAELVVGVIQANHEYDREIMASHAFDVFLSGDDHDYMTGYDGITAYVETSTEARYLAPLDLAVTITTAADGKRTIAWTPSFRFIDTSKVAADPATQALVDGYKAKLDASLNVTIGPTVGPLDSRRNIVRTQEAAIGNLITDAMRETTGADVAITNGGGIRADKQYAAGTVLTRKDILAELPFGNVTVVTELTGQNIWDALENGVSQVENGAGRFPQVSGLKAVVDLKQPAGKRVVSVEVNGKPIDLKATYKVATNDFMLNGGDGYTALSGGNVLIGARGGDLMANDVIDYVAKAGKADAKVEGRIVAR